MKEKLKSKWLAIALAIIILQFILIGLLTRGFRSWNPMGNGRGTEQLDNTPPVREENGGGAIIGEIEDHGVKLLSAKIAKSEYADYGISSLSESAYLLTATIEPANATNKAVDWTVRFVNDSSAWSAGKKASDYVTITPTSDGALMARVECRSAFGEPITIVAASRNNPEAKGTCRVDYAKRVSNVTVTLKKGNTATSTIDFSSEGYAYKWEFAPVYSAGTLEDTFTYAYTLSTNAGLIAWMKENMTLAVNKNLISAGWSTNTPLLMTTPENLLMILNYTGSTSGTSGKVQTNDIYNTFEKYMGTLFDLKIEVKGTYSSNVFSYSYEAGVSTFDISVTDVKIDSDPIVF